MAANSIERQPISLRSRLTEHGPLSVEEVSALIDKLAVAVDTLHQRGDIHGAICPENVWLLADGNVRLLPVPQSARSRKDGPSYYSPETAWNETPTRATDVWAVGALVYEMLTGLVPLPAMNPARLSQPGVRWGAKRLPEAAACAQPVVDRALMRCPSDRYVSAQAIANALWEALPSAPTTDKPAAAAVTTSRPLSALKTALKAPLSPVPQMPAAKRPSLLPLNARPANELTPMQRMYASISAQRTPHA